MDTKTFAAWASFLVSLGAGALTQVPAFTFLAFPIAIVSGVAFSAFVILFAVSNRDRLLAQFEEPTRMILLGLAIAMVGIAISGVGTYRLRTPGLVVAEMPDVNTPPQGTEGFPLAISSGPGGSYPLTKDGLTVDYLQFSAYNLGKVEIHLKRMVLISGATGASKDLLVITDAGRVLASETNPIPPGAMFAVDALFDGMNGAQFTKDWTPMTLEADFDQQVQRISIGRDYFNKLFDGLTATPPRVTKRTQ